jgi:hypothetical protein
MVGRDVLQPARVSMKAGKKEPSFLTPSGSLLLGLNTASLLFFVQCLAQLRQRSSERR